MFEDLSLHQHCCENLKSGIETPSFTAGIYLCIKLIYILTKQNKKNTAKTLTPNVYCNQCIVIFIQGTTTTTITTIKQKTLWKLLQNSIIQFQTCCLTGRMTH